MATPYSGGVALGFPVLKEARPAHGWRKKPKSEYLGKRGGGGIKIPKVKMSRSKWEGHRRLNVGLNERRCTGVLGYLADRLPPISSTESIYRRVVGHTYALGSRS